MGNTESVKKSVVVVDESSHACDEKCSRTAAGKCRVVVRERNAKYYEANRAKVLSSAVERRLYAQKAIAAYEASQKG